MGGKEGQAELKHFEPAPLQTSHGILGTAAKGLGGGEVDSVPRVVLDFVIYFDGWFGDRIGERPSNDRQSY